VAQYLRTFLMDPYVIDKPFLLRWILVNALIVPKRKHSSSQLYKRIWTAEGSPLLIHSQRFIAKAQRYNSSNLSIHLAMRYGQPSIENALKAVKAEGTTSITFVPLYPQYTLSSFETCLVECRRLLTKLKISASALYTKPFFASDYFIDPIASQVKAHLLKLKPDHVLFSYHGIPERHIRKIDDAHACKFTHECCATFEKHSPHCYRAQCFRTTDLIASRADLPKGTYTTSFQSRLGRTPWIKPYSDQVIVDLASKYPHLAVICPSFVADCLETVEEVGIRMTNAYIAAGGRKLSLIPCLNDFEPWVDNVLAMTSDRNCLAIL
jgi:ferrochelatase